MNSAPVVESNGAVLHETREHRGQEPRNDEEKYKRKAADGQTFLPQSPACEAMTIFVPGDEKRDHGREDREYRANHQEKSAKHYHSVRALCKITREDAPQSPVEAKPRHSPLTRSYKL